MAERQRTAGRQRMAGWQSMAGWQLTHMDTDTPHNYLQLFISGGNSWLSHGTNTNIIGKSWLPKLRCKLRCKHVACCMLCVGRKTIQRSGLPLSTSMSNVRDAASPTTSHFLMSSDNCQRANCNRLQQATCSVLSHTSQKRYRGSECESNDTIAFKKRGCVAVKAGNLTLSFRHSMAISPTPSTASCPHLLSARVRHTTWVHIGS